MSQAEFVRTRGSASFPRALPARFGPEDDYVMMAAALGAYRQARL